MIDESENIVAVPEMERPENIAAVEIAVPNPNPPEKMPIYKRVRRVDRYKYRKRARQLSCIDKWGMIKWREVSQLDERMLNGIRRRKTKYHDTINLLLRLPRDGKWYQIDYGARIPLAQIRHIRHALHVALRRVGYAEQVLKMRSDARYIYVWWAKQPESDELDRLEQKKLGLRLQPVQDFHLEERE